MLEKYMRMAHLNGQVAGLLHEIKRLGAMREYGWVTSLDIIDRTCEITEEMGPLQEEVSRLAQELRAEMESA